MRLIALLVLTGLLMAGMATAKEDHRELYRQGVEHNKRGEFDKAIAYYSKAIALRPSSPELYFVRGRAYKQNEQYDEAIKDLTKAVALKPDYAEAYNHRGVVYIGKGDMKAAEADFRKACSQGHEDACRNMKKLKSP